MLIVLMKKDKSDIYDWETRHDGNFSPLFENPELSDQLINKCFISFATQID